MMSSARFRVNVPRVVHETIEGEVVIINLDTGSYYSLDGAGAVIWNRLDEGAAPGEIAGWLAQHYGPAVADFASLVTTLTAQLQAEDLLRPLDDPVVNAHPTGGGPLPIVFAVPVLHKHNDMQDLLLLDPIHEVDATGWPTIKADHA